MRSKRIPTEEQYRLIMECRQSGLTDHQWCVEHDIKPGTFYNWVKRLRQKEDRHVPQNLYIYPMTEVLLKDAHVSVCSEISAMFCSGTPAQSPVQAPIRHLAHQRILRDTENQVRRPYTQASAHLQVH